MEVLLSLRARRGAMMAFSTLAERTAGMRPARASPLVVGGGARKQLSKIVALVADERIMNHASAPTTCRCVGSAIGSRSRNAGRAAATGRGRARRRRPPDRCRRTPCPLGAAFRDDPAPRVDHQRMAEGRTSALCSPPCAAANTNEPFSIARARISTSSAPRRLPCNAEGIARNVAPASEVRGRAPESADRSRW